MRWKEGRQAQVTAQGPEREGPNGQPRIGKYKGFTDLINGGKQQKFDISGTEPSKHEFS